MTKSTKCKKTGDAYCKCDTKQTFRRLFTDHAVYTKFYIESALQTSPDLQAIAARLLENQKDIGNFIGSILHSKKTADAVTKLLQEHILAAAGAVNALKSNNKQALDTAVKKVFDNSAEVSKAISSLNPHKLPYKMVLEQFNHHNQYVLDIATQHFQKDYVKELQTFDEYFDHMMHFSDMINYGLENDSFFDFINCIISFLIICLIIYILYKVVSNK